MFANTQMGGMDFGFPDICLTPMPAPVPIPYPNFGFGVIGVPAVYKVLFMACPAHNLLTQIPVSLGDTPGVLLGIISHTVMGPIRPITGAFRVLVGGLPATRLTSINLHNTFNCLGMRIVPSQFKVIVLAG